MSGRLIFIAFRFWAALLLVGLVVSALWQGGGVLAAKVKAGKTRATAAPPVDPFVVEWFTLKAKEEGTKLGKPKGKITRVMLPADPSNQSPPQRLERQGRIQEFSGRGPTEEKGFFQKFEHGAIAASRFGTFAVTGKYYEEWKPRSGLKPYEFPKK